MGDSLIQTAELIDSVSNLVYVFVGFLVILFSWFALLGVPLVSFFNILKTKKEEGNKGGEEDAMLLYASTSFMTLIVAFLVSVIYFGLFVGVLQVGDTAGEVVNKVLFFNLTSS